MLSVQLQGIALSLNVDWKLLEGLGHFVLMPFLSPVPQGTPQIP